MGLKLGMHPRTPPPGTLSFEGNYTLIVRYFLQRQFDGTRKPFENLI